MEVGDGEAGGPEEQQGRAGARGSSSSTAGAGGAGRARTWRRRRAELDGGVMGLELTGS